MSEPEKSDGVTGARALARRAGLARAIGFGVSTAAVFGVGFLPLFDGPGYEISLAAGLLVPVTVSVSTALHFISQEPRVFDRTCRRVNGDPQVHPSPLDMLLGGVAGGAAFGLAAYLTTLLHGLRAGFCDFWTGTTNFALGPLAGAILGGAWGAVAAEIARRQKTQRGRRALAVLLGIAGPLAGVIVSFARFLSSPMVFAYDPFAGYFSGTLYDTVIDASGLVTYRAGSLATLGAAIVLAMHLARTPDGKLALSASPVSSSAGEERPRPRWGVVIFGALCAIASLVHTAKGSDLGHYQTASTIAEALGGRADGKRCTVLFPRGMRPDEVRRFLQDCDAHVGQIEAWFQAAGPDRITVYLFADVHQKASLMGASDTQIAKPWRREIYIQEAPYPHPIVGHELAHVIAGAFARGPFKTGGTLLGLLPDPGLIEGVAVAASPREGDLSPAEWARAMKDLGILPKLSDLFALGFLGKNSSVAYTVSGAFVGFVRDTYGPAAVRDWYGGKDLPAVTGASWRDLEAKFHATLDALPLTDAARAQAKGRFDRPGIFARRCPHVVDACTRRAEGLRSDGDGEGALAQYAIVQKLDPGDRMVRVQIARTRIRAGDVAKGQEELRAIVADTTLPRHVRDRALEDLADRALAPGGDGAFAAAAYRELMERTVDEDTLRTLEVKALAAEAPRANTVGDSVSPHAVAREAIFQYLIGDPGRGSDRVRAAELLGVWQTQVPDDGTPHYLMARVLHSSGLYREALSRLDLAIARKLPLSRVVTEVHRLRVIDACAAGDPSLARSAYDAYLQRPSVPKARRDAMAALLERCAQAAPLPAAR